MDKNEFSVYLFFPEDHSDCIARNRMPGDAINLAKSYIARPAGDVGFIRRIIVTDGGDFTVFEWIYDDWITFPRPEDLDKSLSDDLRELARGLQYRSVMHVRLWQGQHSYGHEIINPNDEKIGVRSRHTRAGQLAFELFTLGASDYQTFEKFLIAYRSSQ